MNHSANKRKQLASRHMRVRKKVSGSKNRPRLAVFRSSKHIYAQIIDDTASSTIASASSLDADGKSNGETKIESARIIGDLIANRAISKGIKSVVFDRGGFKYHGRVKSLADAARKGGLKF
ncbi:MAG: 50S ribosomal protein L18 [SAR202 cluster bacterium]|nr:50S ribosomal protein L18 [Chloroflexota bacterium]MQG39557.1 50S ribosomal protein L18 [SAR202 cluster bacterium]|tara:strand:+ start:3802 stop:4164 length:363 start_codon:yes stop_codon:yes gene_type:complete